MPEKSGPGRGAQRRGKARSARAHAAKREQDEATQRREAWEQRRRRRITAYGLMALGLVIAGAHVLEHAGAFHLLPNPTLEDFLIGYPTGGILLVIGLAMLPAQRY